MAGSRPRAASLVATPLWLEKSHAKPAPSVGVGSARGGCRSPSENASSLPCFTGLCRRPSVARRLGRLSVTSRPDQKDSMATTYTRIQYGSARERKRGHACGTARSIPVSTLEHRSGAHDIPANDNWMFTAFGCITRYGPVPQSVQKCLRSSGTAKMVSTSPLPPGWVHSSLLQSGWSNAPPSGGNFAKRQDNLPELCTWKNNSSDSKSKRYKFALQRT